MNWTEYFLLIAENVKLKSKDRSTQIGAVIVGRDNEILSTGYNSFPRGLDDTLEERQERPEKYFYMIHAEANSIVNAARTGISIKDSKIYLTCGIPCADCAKLIINSGIVEVYCKNTQEDVKGSHWIESKKKTIEMFKECNIQLNFYS
jgi:dCMP deaminase